MSHINEPPDGFESDWAAIQALRVALGALGTREVPEDFEEDWDVLQGGSCWFVALYDSQAQRIPGTTLRVQSLQGWITWQAKPHVPVGDTRIGYWSRAEPTVRLLQASFTQPPSGRVGLSTYLNIITFTMTTVATTSTIPVNIGANTGASATPFTMTLWTLVA